MEVLRQGPRPKHIRSDEKIVLVTEEVSVTRTFFGGCSGFGGLLGVFGESFHSFQLTKRPRRTSSKAYKLTYIYI